MLALEDPPKAGSGSALRELHRLGLRVIMVTGDHEATAKRVAEGVGIDEIRAGLSPSEKQGVVRALRDAGAVVAFAGDGINDAPALAAADVGIAMGTGTDVAIESAGLILVKGDLGALVRAVHLSRAVMGNIEQNLFFAFVYNGFGIPIAAGLLYPFTGWLLNPMIAGVAMSLSSLSVVSNALRLRRVKL
jgi:Cu+-exporting ATPase